MNASHRVGIVTGPGGRVRADCHSCQWRSPWLLADQDRRGIGPDLPARDPAALVRVATVVAVRHLRAP